jgi:hypothetical protein
VIPVAVDSDPAVTTFINEFGQTHSSIGSNEKEAIIVKQEILLLVICFFALLSIIKL